MFCLEKPEIEKLKKAIKDKGKKLSDMTTSERIGVFDSVLNVDTATNLNQSFEKALTSKRADAISKWVENTFTPQQKKEDAYTQIEKDIERIRDLDIELADNAMDNIIASTLESSFGFNVTKEEFAQLSKMVDELRALDKPHPDLPENSGYKQIDFYKKRNEISNYIKSKAPSSKINVALRYIGTSSLLWNPSTLGLNIIGNTVAGAGSKITFISPGNKKYLSPEMKELSEKWKNAARDIYAASGIDITRTKDISQLDIIQGEKIISAEGIDRLARKLDVDKLLPKISDYYVDKTITQQYGDVVFREGLGKPDSFFARTAFANVAENYVISYVRSVGKIEGWSKQKIQEESIGLLQEVYSAETQTGVEYTSPASRIKEMAMQEAMITTFTENGNLSKGLTGFRNAISNLFGGTMVGEALSPFVKTPANVVEQGIKYGTGYSLIVEPILNWKRITEKYKNATGSEDISLRNLELRNDVFNPMIRSGLFMTIALAISSMFDEEDYLKGYLAMSPSERKLAVAEGKVFNSLNLQIGGENISISTDYLGPISPIIKGMMSVKILTSPDLNKADKTAYYWDVMIQGSLKEAPVVDQIATIFGLDDDEGNTPHTIQETGLRTATDIVDFISSRFTPSVLNTLAQSSSAEDRDKYSFPVLGPLLSRIPGANRLLDTKHDAFGYVVEDPVMEKLLLKTLFGSRVKLDEVHTVKNEYNRLNSTGNMPTIQDPAKSKMIKMQKLVENAPKDVVDEWYITFSEEFNKQAERRIKSSVYEKLSDEEKKDTLNKVRKNAIDFSLIKYSKYTR